MSNMPIKILLVEDNPGDFRLIREMLSEARNFPFNLKHTDRLSIGLEQLVIEDFDVILSDLSLPDSQGIDTFIKIHSQVPQVPIIMLTGFDDEELAVRAVREGAQDYLIKGRVDGDLLVRAIRYAIERGQAEKALAAEKERLAVTLRSIGDGVITTDAERKITLVNKIAEIFTGWTEEKAIGKPLGEVFHIVNEKTRKCCENLAEKVLGIGELNSLANHSVLIARDGIERVITSSGSPIRDKDSKVIGVVLVLRDITEKRKIEEELLKVHKLESVGTLAGGIAHDFNNLLTGIMGNVSLARMYTDQDKVSERLIDAEKALLRARDLTQQLLTFSKGGTPIKKTASITEILEDSANFALSGSNVRSELYIPDDLWSVEIDEGQISQVINNLIINADQSMPDGGLIKVRAENVPVGSMHILPLKEEEYIKISIEDQGIGIPQEHLPRIFDPYFTTKQKGSGLGLATSYSIIKNHDGYITAESQVSIGTTFQIYLPASPKQILTKKKEEEKCIIGNGKILVMDDEELIRRVACEILNSIGYEVTTAKNGTEAIKLYKEANESGSPFDAVIMDLTIPGGMGGKEATQKLIETNPGVKVIVSSGYSNDPVMSNFKEYGFSDVIAKPYRIKELSEILHRLLTDVSE